MRYYFPYRFLSFVFGFFFLLQSAFAQADLTDFVPDEEGAASGSFTLDQDGLAGAGDSIVIEFGAVLGETLQFDVDDDRFELSNDLSLEGNELESFRIENLASDPATCDGTQEGRLYYNTGSDELQLCADGNWGAVGSGGGGSVDQTNIVYVDGTRATQTGEVYATLAAAAAYVSGQTPSSGNRWVILMEPGTNTENVTIPTFTHLVGRDRQSTIFTGTLTLSANSALQGLIVNGGGEVDIPNGNTGYVSDADVNIDDGASGGIDGMLVIHDSFVDGEIGATGAVMAYNSVIGPTALTNDGSLATYHSTVLTLTNNNIWNNFASAYNNADIVDSADRLDATDIQGAIDELVFGTPSDFFTIDENQGGAADVTLEFGSVVNETLSWDNTNDYFTLSDALVTEGNINLNGDLGPSETILRFDADNTAAGGQNARIIAEQGTDNDGELRYNATTNQWEISNDGGGFFAITQATGDEEYFDAYSTSTTNVTGGFTDIPLNVERKKTSAFTHALNSAEVVVNDTGSYVVSFTVTTDISSGVARSQSEMQLVLNGSPVAGSLGRLYNRLDSQGESTATRVLVLDLTSGDILKIQARRFSGSDTIVTLAEASSLTIVRTAGIGPPGPQGPQGLPGTVGLGTNETSFTIDQDESGNPDQDIDIIAEQGTEPSGIIRFDDGNDRWEFSNDGGSTFDPIQVGSSSPCGDNGVFWAERGTVTSNQSWAMGNGQTPFGSVMGCSGTVRQIAATCTGSIGTSLNAVLRKNDTVTACSVNLSTTVGQATINSCSETFLSTDVLGIYAGTENGTWTECVGTFWVEYD